MGVRLMEDERQAYINEQVQKRGYVQEYHKVMIANDLEVAKKSNDLIDAVFIKDRSLDRMTRELIFVAGLTCLRAPQWQIKQHIKIAVDRGATKEMLLEAIELTIFGAGFVAFQHGLLAWQEFFDAPKQEPTVHVYEQKIAETAERVI
jgi:4-carboxymuconolactone decarboxylase